MPSLLEALKAVAQAVGDGKIVAAHAFVRYTAPMLSVTDGRQWANARVDYIEGEATSFCVRYSALKQALERDGATLATGPAWGVIVRVGRSRTTIRGLDPLTLPPVPFDGAPRNNYDLPTGFNEIMRDLLPYAGSSEGHIWQMGVHLQPDFCFTSGPFALVKCGWSGIGHAYTIPPWAAEFIASHEISPRRMLDYPQGLKFLWDDLTLTTTLLVEEPPEYAVTRATNLATEGGIPVPDNLKDTVKRLKAYGAKRFRMGLGKIDHTTDEIEVEEEISIDTPARIWGVETVLAALEHAETLDLSHNHAVWHGNGYHGAFSGMSGGSQ